MLGGVDNQLFFQSLSGFVVMAIFIILLKWGFARGKSLAARPIVSGDDEQYGLLRVVAKPSNHIEGEMIRRRLSENGIKATLTQTKVGPRVMVFESELRIAEAILRS